jgi:hypothetical protein
VDEKLENQYNWSTLDKEEMMEAKGQAGPIIKALEADGSLDFILCAVGDTKGL